MLHLITSPTDSFIDYMKDDPVRPQLSKEFRTGKNKFVSVLLHTGETPAGIVCVSLHDFIPESESDLTRETDNPNTAIFYTIWSYMPGSGARLLHETVSYIKSTNSNITNFLTLSPKTEMAKKFHLKNGALVYRENSSTINYQYTLIAP